MQIEESKFKCCSIYCLCLYVFQDLLRDTVENDAMELDEDVQLYYANVRRATKDQFAQFQRMVHADVDRSSNL